MKGACVDAILGYGPVLPFAVAAFFWARGLSSRRGDYLIAGGAVSGVGLAFHLIAIRYVAFLGLPWVALLVFGASAAAAGALRRGDARAMKREIAAGAACLVVGLGVLAAERAWLGSSNSILVIAPYRHAGTWVFDDPRAGLRAEPFVAGAPEIIDRVVADIPNAEKGFRLLFSAAPFPGHATKLVWRRPGGGGNWYWSEDFGKEGWLCPALFKYFPRAPGEIYLKAEAINRQRGVTKRSPDRPDASGPTAVAGKDAPANAERSASRLVSSATQYGITWTFAAPARVGRFVTGDWWVVGPVTVASVDPAPAEGRNGSVVDPAAGKTQGYDDRAHNFDGALRAVFPLELAPGRSLVSTASVETVGVKTPDTVKGQYCRGPLRTAAVLTVVKEPPTPDAFRPAYVGKWREHFRASRLRRDALPRLAPPGDVPVVASDIAPYERYIERIWLDHQREWVNRKMHPLENMPDYGREITNIVSDVALLVLLDDPRGERETLLLRFVQKGIDYYGAALSHDDLWVANGGHNSGRKWPILFAGLMLGHAGMTGVKASFQEDQQTYHGKGFGGRTVLWTINALNPNARHEEVDPSSWETFGDTRGNSGVKAEGYRKLNGPTWVGQALAARLTGMTGAWGHDAFFDYVDRWWREEGKANAFVTAMWKAYRAEADATGAEVQQRLRSAGP